jgi:hypothetical protein
MSAPSVTHVGDGPDARLRGDSRHGVADPKVKLLITVTGGGAMPARGTAGAAVPDRDAAQRRVDALRFYHSFYCAARDRGVRAGTAEVECVAKPLQKGTIRYAVVRAERLI